MTRLLLCTDLDRTLLPNGRQPESIQARKIFSHLVSRPEITLVYVTGRDPLLVEDAISEYSIPQPDYVIADVGASIYKLDEKDWQHWLTWDTHISQAWGAHSHGDLKTLLKPFLELKLQEATKQSTFKLSYYVPLAVSHKMLLDEIDKTLLKKNINASLIWSIDEEKDIGLLDILPGNAGKREAIDFLSNQLKFDYSEVIFAGDSGNDISVMASPIQAVLVSNASDEVKEEAQQQAKNNGCESQLYLAQGDYYGLNGNYSAGILEGVEHYMNQSKEWIWGEL